MDGWDVASLVAVEIVNTAIQSKSSSLKTFQVKTESLDVQSDFGAWQITLGDSADLSMFNIPVPSITGKVFKVGQTIIDFTYEALEARVQLALQLVDFQLKHSS